MKKRDAAIKAREQQNYATYSLKKGFLKNVVLCMGKCRTGDRQNYGYTKTHFIYVINQNGS